MVGTAQKVPIRKAYKFLWLDQLYQLLELIFIYSATRMGWKRLKGYQAGKIKKNPDAGWESLLHGSYLNEPSKKNQPKKTQREMAKIPLPIRHT